jgi:predicted RNase H-like HicB family nuclease
MQYQVFVQNSAEQHFLAAIVGVPDVTAEGQTEAEAIAKAKTALESKLAMGKLVTIEIETQNLEPEDDPWIKHMGIFTNDPTFDDFLQEVAAYRQQVDIRESKE